MVYNDGNSCSAEDRSPVGLTVAEEPVSEANAAPDGSTTHECDGVADLECDGVTAHETKVRVSARLRQKSVIEGQPDDELVPEEAPTNIDPKTPSKIRNRTGVGSRPAPQWSWEEINDFFHALMQHGKNFERIHKQITQKQRKRFWNQKAGAAPKTTEALKQLYRRYVVKVVKHVQLPSEFTRTRRELHALVNYWALNSVVGKEKSVDEWGRDDWIALQELIDKGSTRVRVGGSTRKEKVKTPSCPAMRVDQEPGLPETISLRLRPKNNRTAAYIQKVAQNPQLQLTGGAALRLGEVAAMLRRKWKPLHQESLAALQVGLEPPGSCEIRFSLPANVTPLPVDYRTQEQRQRLDDADSNSGDGLAPHAVVGPLALAGVDAPGDHSGDGCPPHPHQPAADGEEGTRTKTASIKVWSATDYDDITLLDLHVMCGSPQVVDLMYTAYGDNEDRSPMKGGDVMSSAPITQALAALIRLAESRRTEYRRGRNQRPDSSCYCSCHGDTGITTSYATSTPLKISTMAMSPGGGLMPPPVLNVANPGQQLVQQLRTLTQPKRRRLPKGGLRSIQPNAIQYVAAQPEMTPQHIQLLPAQQLSHPPQYAAAGGHQVLLLGPGASYVRPKAASSDDLPCLLPLRSVTPKQDLLSPARNILVQPRTPISTSFQQFNTGLKSKVLHGGGFQTAASLEQTTNIVDASFLTNVDSLGDSTMNSILEKLGHDDQQHTLTTLEPVSLTASEAAGPPQRKKRRVQLETLLSLAPTPPPMQETSMDSTINRWQLQVAHLSGGNHSLSNLFPAEDAATARVDLANYTELDETNSLFRNSIF